MRCAIACCSAHPPARGGNLGRPDESSRTFAERCSCRQNETASSDQHSASQHRQAAAERAPSDSSRGNGSGSTSAPCAHFGGSLRPPVAFVGTPCSALPALQRMRSGRSHRAPSLSPSLGLARFSLRGLAVLLIMPKQSVNSIDLTPLGVIARVLESIRQRNCSSRSSAIPRFRPVHAELAPDPSWTS